MAKRRMLKLFGRERETLQVERARAGRAIYLGPDQTEVEVRLYTEANGELILRMSPSVARVLIADLHNTYYAINPPLRTGGYQADWQGMDDDG